MTSLVILGDNISIWIPHSRFSKTQVNSYGSFSYLGDEKPLHGSPELGVEQPVYERWPDPVAAGEKRHGELHRRRRLQI